MAVGVADARQHTSICVDQHPRTAGAGDRRAPAGGRRVAAGFRDGRRNDGRLCGRLRPDRSPSTVEIRPAATRKQGCPRRRSVLPLFSRRSPNTSTGRPTCAGSPRRNRSGCRRAVASSWPPTRAASWRARTAATARAGGVDRRISVLSPPPPASGTGGGFRCAAPRRGRPQRGSRQCGGSSAWSEHDVAIVEVPGSDPGYRSTHRSSRRGRGIRWTYSYSTPTSAHCTG